MGRGAGPAAAVCATCRYDGNSEWLGVVLAQVESAVWCEKLFVCGISACLLFSH